MLKMSNKSQEFLEQYLPQVLDSASTNDALDIIYDFIDENGFAPPHYEEYNDLGRSAQKVYDDIFLNND